MNWDELRWIKMSDWIQVPKHDVKLRLDAMNWMQVEMLAQASLFF